MTTEDIYIESGYQMPQDKHDECSKRFDYWDMIAFADFVTEKRVKNNGVLEDVIPCHNCKGEGWETDISINKSLKLNT